MFIDIEKNLHECYKNDFGVPLCGVVNSDLIFFLFHLFIFSDFYWDNKEFKITKNLCLR
jgi:hypothetical protein